MRKTLVFGLGDSPSNLASFRRSPRTREGHAPNRTLRRRCRASDPGRTPLEAIRWRGASSQGNASRLGQLCEYNRIRVVIEMIPARR